VDAIARYADALPFWNRAFAFCRDNPADGE
jgi:hypothetical protein